MQVERLLIFKKSARCDPLTDRVRPVRAIVVVEREDAEWLNRFPRRIEGRLRSGEVVCVEES